MQPAALSSPVRTSGSGRSRSGSGSSASCTTTWASSMISPVESSAHRIRSELKCYPCLRNNPLPMCPE
jgi:hypothetical protein